MSRDAKEVTPELARAIARAIASSANTVLVQRCIPGADKIATELGNNCAQNVVYVIERFLEDGTVAEEEKA